MFGKTLNKNKHYRWLCLVFAMLMMGINTAGTQTLSALMPKIRADITMSNTQQGLLTSAYVVAGIFLPLILPSLYKRFSICALSTVGAVVSACGWLMFLSSGSFEVLVVSRFIAGLGGVVLMVSAPLVVSYAFSDGQLGLAMGIYGISPPLASVITLNTLGRFENWHTAIGVIIALLAVIAAGIGLFLYFPAQHANSGGSESGKLAKSREPLGTDIMKVAVLGFAFSFCTLSYVTYAPAYYGQIGLSAQQASLVTSLYMGLNIPFAPLCGMIMDRDRRNKRTMAVVSLVVLALLNALVSFAFMPGKVILGVLMGVATSAPPIAMFSLYVDVLPKERLALGPCIVGVIQNIGQTAGPIFCGALLDNSLGYGAIFMAMAVILAAAALAMAALKFRGLPEAAN